MGQNRTKLIVNLTKQQDGSYVLSWKQPSTAHSSQTSSVQSSQTSSVQSSQTSSVQSSQTSSVHSSGTIVQTVTIAEVEADFPEYCNAIRESHSDLNPVVDLKDLIMCAAYSYAESEMRRKRFQVYTHLAYVSGFSARTKLPEAVEASVKSTWHDEDEEFVGFLPN